MKVFQRHRFAPRDQEFAQLRLVETLIVIAWLLVATGTFRSLLASGSDDREAGSMAFQAVTLSIYAGGLAMMALRGVPAWFPRLAAAAWPLLALTGLALLSTVWSDSPMTTLRRAIALCLTTSFAFYVVSRFDLSRFAYLAGMALLAMLVISLVSAAVPGIGITPSGLHEGAWRGLAGQKNEFGRACGLAVTFFAVGWFLAYPGRRTSWAMAAVLALALLILSTSKTPITAIAVAFVGTAINLLVLRGQISTIRVSMELRMLLTVAIVGLTIVSVFWLVPLIVAAMGRDLTFSGRTELWKWAIAQAADTPWLGSGYRGFWNDGNTKYFFEFFAWKRSVDGELSDSYSGPTHAHSGYVDLWLELGWVGVAAYAMLIVSAFVRIAGCFQRQCIGAALYLSTFTWFLLAYAFTAKSVLQQSEDLWFFFLVFYLYAARATVERPVSSAWRPIYTGSRRGLRHAL